MDIEAFKYKYETHLHTTEGSACARNSAVDMMKACKANGYTGSFVTDHAWGGNTSVNRNLGWKEWLYLFNKGYDNAKAWGEANDFQVFYGYEAGYEGTEFLIYGLTPEWMMEHPELHDADIPSQYKLVHEGGGIVIQAHPFRKEAYIPEVRLFPDDVDGVETINATHSSHLSLSHNVKEWNDLAIEYALKHNKTATAGSDVHSTNLFGGGMLFDHKMESAADFVATILSEDMYLLTDGDRIYTRYGEVL